LFAAILRPILENFEWIASTRLQIGRENRGSGSRLSGQRRRDRGRMNAARAKANHIGLLPTLTSGPLFGEKSRGVIENKGPIPVTNPNKVGKE
jgi:hypothetical protein